jgi:hypothetical protein
VDSILAERFICIVLQPSYLSHACVENFVQVTEIRAEPVKRDTSKHTGDHSSPSNHFSLAAPVHNADSEAFAETYAHIVGTYAPRKDQFVVPAIHS